MSHGTSNIYNITYIQKLLSGSIFILIFFVSLYSIKIYQSFFWKREWEKFLFHRCLIPLVRGRRRRRINNSVHPLMYVSSSLKMWWFFHSFIVFHYFFPIWIYNKHMNHICEKNISIYFSPYNISLFINNFEINLQFIINRIMW